MHGDGYLGVQGRAASSAFMTVKPETGSRAMSAFRGCIVGNEVRIAPRGTDAALPR